MNDDLITKLLEVLQICSARGPAHQEALVDDPSAPKPAGEEGRAQGLRRPPMHLKPSPERAATGRRWGAQAPPVQASPEFDRHRGALAHGSEGARYA